MQRELVERARSGDLEAFSELARASITRLYAVATLILRDADRAEDAVQDAMLLAWRDVRAIRDPDAWDAWLHRLTVRACYKHARKERRRIAVEVTQEPGPELLGAPDHASLVVDRDLLARGIASLPIEQRAVLVVHYYLDLPLARSAEVLGIPVGTVKTRLHHGLKALRGSVVEPTERSGVRGQEATA